MKITDIDGVLVVNLDPFAKGGPGSGRYPAGSSGGSSGGGSKGKGGGAAGSAGGGKELQSALSIVDEKLSNAEDINDEGKPKAALGQVERAHETLSTQLERLDNKGILDDDDSVNIEQNLDRADDLMSRAKNNLSSGNNGSAGNNVAGAIEFTRKAAEILQGYNP